MSIFHRFLWFLGNSRIAERRSSGQRVTLTWRDRHGEGIAYGTCQDVSSDGMGVECCEPIPLKTPVVASMDRWAKPASVRYSRERGGSYRIGLEFLERRPK